MVKGFGLFGLLLLVSGCVVSDGPYRPHYYGGPVYVERAPVYRYDYRPPPPHYRHGPPRSRYYHY